MTTIPPQHRATVRAFVAWLRGEGECPEHADGFLATLPGWAEYAADEIGARAFASRLEAALPHSAVRMERAIFRAAAPRRSYPTSTRDSSHRFGPCQACGEHVSEVYMTPTDNGVRYVFGHEACVTPLVSLHPMPRLTAGDVERLRLPAVRAWMAAGLAVPSP